jgi:hypothetical protein
VKGRCRRGEAPAREGKIMIKTIVRLGVVLLFGVASALAGATTAGADPGGSKQSFQVTVDCDNGATYQLILIGNGEFAAGHDSASNSIIVPTAIGSFHGVLTDAEGNVIDEFTDPPATKGNATKDRATSAECTFEFDQTFTDPELGIVHFHGEGSVTVFVTPVR